ncbi:hypothetical protein MPQ_2678 [Methylovorus sp. MP688]|nr:hypothetical protein MPQ_2678 [Methylovorus sp. MP688]
MHAQPHQTKEQNSTIGRACNAALACHQPTVGIPCPSLCLAPFGEAGKQSIFKPHADQATGRIGDWGKIPCF